MPQYESDYRLAMVYHENGGNDSFEVKGGHMSTLKAFSDPNMSHNFMVFSKCDDSQMRSVSTSTAVGHSYGKN